MSCGKKTEVTAPTVLLSETEMVEVITDVYVIENAINHRRGKGTKVSNLKTKGFDAVFSHYGITDSIFYDNIDYYNIITLFERNIKVFLLKDKGLSQEE